MGVIHYFHSELVDSRLLVAFCVEHWLLLTFIKPINVLSSVFDLLNKIDTRIIVKAQISLTLHGQKKLMSLLKRKLVAVKQDLFDCAEICQTKGRRKQAVIIHRSTPDVHTLMGVDLGHGCRYQHQRQQDQDRRKHTQR